MSNILSPTHKRQGTLLNHFTSLSYLIDLKKDLNELITFANNLLDIARQQDRDRHLRSQQWGDRNTSSNWGNNAWAYLIDFQQSLARKIAARSFEEYAITASTHYARGMSEYSMDWMTVGEQEQFDKMFQALQRKAEKIDLTTDRTGPAPRWNDSSLTKTWITHFPGRVDVPKFRVREDIRARTGEVPPRTGLYVCREDPNATLQFAWNGGRPGPLLCASTFNDLGLAALDNVGRADLWVDGKKMLKFLQANLNNAELQADWFFSSSQTEQLAGSLVALHSFTEREGTWHFVEMCEGEFETIDADAVSVAGPSPRFEAGQTCNHPGYYFTPARADSRQFFNTGDNFPRIDAQYGASIWQWDEDQVK